MCSYDIDRNGVFTKDGKILSQSRHSAGYMVVSMNRKTKYIHRLVAEKYIPNPNNHRTINHINGDKSDNRVENLEWSSDRMNTEHARLNGLSETKQLGITNLTKQQVLHIVKERQKGRTYKSIAIEMNRNERTIWDICNGKRYKDYLIEKIYV
jgi:DNA-binding NarL/FixJ family response regulator